MLRCRRTRFRSGTTDTLRPTSRSPTQNSTRTDSMPMSVVMPVRCVVRTTAPEMRVTRAFCRPIAKQSVASSSSRWKRQCWSEWSERSAKSAIISASTSRATT